MANLLSTTVNGALNSTGRITASYDTDRYQMNFNRASASNWWVTNDAGNLGFHLNNVGDRFYFGTGGDFWSSANGWLSTALAGKLSTGGTAANSSQLEGFSAYALVTEARGAHSGSDFPNGTLVTTDINANGWAGDSFIMEVSGKSYGSGTPFKLIMEGYLYADTIINVSAMSYGSYFPAPVKVMRYNGNIAFWWPRGSYWNSFEVHVRSANGDSWNRVTGITDSVDPASADKKISITPTQVIHTGNIGSQSVSYATTAGSITGQANSATINASTGVNANDIVRRDGNGYIYANHINFSTTESENPTISSFITSNGDGWSRKSSLAHVRNQLGNYGNWITTDGRAYPRRSDGTNINFYWDGQGGQPTWLWGSNNGTDFYVWNPSNFSVNYASSSNTANYLPTLYAGGVQANPQTYFGQSVGLRVAMTGVPFAWCDTLWINGYSGGDVLSMCAIHTARNGQPRMWISSQNSNGSSYGTTYEVITSWNIASQSVSYADESGYSASSGSVEWTSVQNKPATFPPSSHTHDLMRYSLRAPDNVDSMTSSNFRTQMFGSASNGWNLSTGRWNTVPSGLSGMNSYGTLFAWSGSDTHGFIAADYSTANVQVGGGYGDNITWKATLIHDGNYSSYVVPKSGGSFTGGIGGTTFDFGGGGYIGGATTFASSISATILYDSNDQSYYVDPNGLSRIYRLSIVGDWAGANPNEGAINIRGNYPSMTFRNTISGNMWLRHMDGAGDIQHYFAPSGVDATDWSIKHSMRTDGTFQSNGSMRAPIFYDSNDTNYYGDFAGFSRMSEIGVTNNYVYNYDWIDSSRAVSEFGNVGKYVAKRSGAADYPSFSFEHTFGNHSWGQVARFHIGGSGGVDRPSIQFSSAQSNDRWNIGFCTGTDNNFRISQNMGYRPDGSGVSDGWGTPRLTIDTGGTVTVNSLVATGYLYSQGFIYMNNDNPIVWGSSTSIEANQSAITVRVNTGIRAVFNNTGGLYLTGDAGTNTGGLRLKNSSGTESPAMWVQTNNRIIISNANFAGVTIVTSTRINSSLGVNVDASATAGRIDAGNDIVAYSSSDERLKENIAPIENALDKVKSLTGVEFDWKPEYKHAHGYEGHDTGIIAQQVEAVMPSAVRTNDTGFLAVRYEKLIGLLIEGMKEQQAQIDELKAKLDGLTK